MNTVGNILITVLKEGKIKDISQLGLKANNGWAVYPPSGSVLVGWGWRRSAMQSTGSLHLGVLQSLGASPR